VRGSKVVLVIDDDQDVRETTADAVQATGRQALTARDGGEALALLDAPNFPRPCVILCDWWMSPMDGAEFLRRLMARPDAAHFSVVVVTGSIPAEDGASMRGVVGILPKPFEFEDLVQALDEHC
jgi:CheY-like chemotaxis protein